MDILETLKPKGAGGWISAALSGVFLAATMLINIGSNKTHNADVQAQQEKRLTVLEEVVKNDLATRRELGEFKDGTNTRLIRIEKKLDEELSFHRR